MENNQQIPSQLIEQFLSGKLSASEEKELLDWIDSTPNSFVLFQKEQERLRPIIAKRQEEETTAQWKKLLHRLYERKTSTTRPLFRIFYPVAAAALAIAFILGVLFYSSKKTAYVAENNTEVVTQCGEKTSLTLSDGTSIILNSGSKLIYPKIFKGKTRNVNLYGEAFFEVSPDKEKPFIVNTYDISVRVLGTAFNLQAFPEAGEISTTLVHGKVLLEKNSGDKVIPLAEMAPHEHAVYQTRNQKISIHKENNIDQYIAWKDGKLVFLNTSGEEVAKKLERWYNVSVQIQSEELKKAHFTGTFTNETIDQVLKLLKISYPIEYSIIKPENNTDENDPVFHIILSSGK